MHALVRTLQLGPEPDRLDRARTLFAHTQLPILQAQPGYHSVLYLADPKLSRALLVSLWDSDAAARAHAAQPDETSPPTSVLPSTPADAPDRTHDASLLLGQSGGQAAPIIE